MKTEFLKELGLEQEVITKIMAENGKDIEKLKAQVSTLNTEKENLSKQLTDANAKIESFSEIDVDKIKAETEDWKQKYTQAQEDAKKELSELKFSHALDSKLSSTKAKDLNILKSLLNKEDLKLTEAGDILGLEDQISKIKEEKSFLFDDEDGKPTIVKGGTGGSSGSTNDLSAARAALGLPPIKE